MTYAKPEYVVGTEVPFHSVRKFICTWVSDFVSMNQATVRAFSWGVHICRPIYKLAKMKLGIEAAPRNGSEIVNASSAMPAKRDVGANMSDTGTEVRIGYNGAVPECKGGGNVRSPSKPVDQRHQPARFRLAKIREWPGRGLNPARLGGRLAWMYHSPSLPRRRTGFKSRRSHSRVLACGNRAGGFSRVSLVSPHPCIPALGPHPHWLSRPPHSTTANNTFTVGERPVPNWLCRRLTSKYIQALIGERSSNMSLTSVASFCWRARQFHLCICHVFCGEDAGFGDGSAQAHGASGVGWPTRCRRVVGSCPGASDGADPQSHWEFVNKSLSLPEVEEYPGSRTSAVILKKKELEVAVNELYLICSAYCTTITCNVRGFDLLAASRRCCAVASPSGLVRVRRLRKVASVAVKNRASSPVRDPASNAWASAGERRGGRNTMMIFLRTARAPLQRCARGHYRDLRDVTQGRWPAYLKLFCAFATAKRRGRKDETATRIKCAIAPKRKALNWRAVFSCTSPCPPPTWANRARFPVGSLPDSRMWESCPDDAAGRRIFPGDLPFTPLLHSGAAPCTLSSQDLAVESCPNLSAPFRIRWNARAGETGDPRVNSPTCGFDYHMRKSANQNRFAYVGGDCAQPPATLTDLIRAAQMDWVLRPEDDLSTLITSMLRCFRDLCSVHGGHTRRRTDSQLFRRLRPILRALPVTERDLIARELKPADLTTVVWRYFYPASEGNVLPRNKQNKIRPSPLESLCCTRPKRERGLGIHTGCTERHATHPNVSLQCVYCRAQRASFMANQMTGGSVARGGLLQGKLALDVCCTLLLASLHCRHTTRVIEPLLLACEWLECIQIPQAARRILAPAACTENRCRAVSGTWPRGQSVGSQIKKRSSRCCFPSVLEMSAMQATITADGAGCYLWSRGYLTRRRLPEGGCSSGVLPFFKVAEIVQ
ncbi:hypothetical protein PR048_014033 [Dryococelus australis]|uniref:Uncharacterized protein n=1 Tax=Dryococelus australis TaxID=614101 RepID=A0ABQ9HUS6_9NEOP|nr:hypothetical protein PR048_014033 [Dryococelus australis]